MGSTTDNGLFKPEIGVDDLSTNDFAFVGRNMDIIDADISHMAAHRHDGATVTSGAAPGAPEAIVSTSVSGAFPGSTTLYYKVAKVIAGVESVASDALAVTTPDKLASPGVPTLEKTLTGGTLVEGIYDYTVTAWRGFYTFDTIAGVGAAANLLGGGSAQKVHITLPALPSDADGLNIYRRVPGSVTYELLASVAAADIATPVVDDGTLVPPALRVLPATDYSAAAFAILIHPGILSAGEKFRVYRTTDPDIWTQSFIAERLYTDPDTFTDPGAAPGGHSPLTDPISVVNPQPLDIVTETVGKLPAERIDGSIGGGGTPYQIDIVGQWNGPRGVAAVGGDPAHLPIITIEGLIADMRPVPPPNTGTGGNVARLRNETQAYLGAPVLGSAPVAADIPADDLFEPSGPGSDDNETIGVFLPVPDVPLTAGQAAWLKSIYTDRVGASATLHYYLVWQPDDTEDFTVHIVRKGHDTVTITAPGAAVTGDPGAAVTETIELVFGAEVDEMWRRRARAPFAAQWNYPDALAGIGGTAPVMTVGCAFADFVPAISGEATAVVRGRVLPSPLGHAPNYSDVPLPSDLVQTGAPASGTFDSFLLPPSFISFAFPDWVPGSALWLEQTVEVNSTGDRMVQYLYFDAVPDDDSVGFECWVLSGGAVTHYEVPAPAATLEQSTVVTHEVVVDWEPHEVPAIEPVAGPFIDAYRSGQTDALERVPNSMTSISYALPADTVLGWIISPECDVSITALTMRVKVAGGTGGKFRFGIYNLAAGVATGAPLVDVETATDVTVPADPTETFTANLIGGKGYLAVIMSNDATAEYSTPNEPPGISMGGLSNSPVSCLLAGYAYGPLPDGADLTFGQDSNRIRPYLLWTIA